MNEKYQVEIDNFIQRFGKYQALRIVLYGIGRYTTTLLEGIEGFHIVGLMDKDPANIGREMYGIPVIDQDTAEKIADMVIINTAETYWSVIYERIKDIAIPVYYLNGTKAEIKQYSRTENSFRNLSYEKLLIQIEKAQLVSFDFFDTLFMRSVCSPQDVFRIMESQLNIPLLRLRDEAKKNIRENYSLDELYTQIELLGDLPKEQIEVIKRQEIELEQKLLVPRGQILSCLKKLLDQGREVYIVSDMYLPKKFYIDVFRQYGIMISDKIILLSNELNASKADGMMWKYYAENIVKGRRALHIGDHQQADIERPKRYEIETSHTPSVWELLQVSSLYSAAPRICGLYDTAVMGCVLSRLFENPYTFYGTNGTIMIKNNFDMGYCVFGPVVLTSLLWLIEQSKSDDMRRLVFTASNGGFLKEDFEYLCELLGETRECCYIDVAKQLALDKDCVVVDIGYFQRAQDITEEINQGVKRFITDYIERFGEYHIFPNRNFIDWYYRKCFDGSLELGGR